MNKPFALVIALCLLAPTTSIAASLSGRVTRLENILDNQSGSDMLLEMQRLQQEVQQLRGLVEQLRFELEKLGRQQKDQYLDLDARLVAVGGAPTAAPTSPVDGAASAAGDGAANSADAMLTPKSPSGQVGRNLTLPSPNAATQSVSEREAYRNGFDLLKQRRYDEAAAAFNDLLAHYPSGEFSDNARYWLGETYYVKRDYSAAIAEYQIVLDDYPLSPKVAGAMLKIGYIQDERKDWKRARATLEDLVQRFPDSTEARLAMGRLEQMTRVGR